MEVPLYSVESVPTDVGEHRAADDKRRNNQGGENAGPKTHATKRYKQDAVFACKVDACLIRQKGLYSHCNQKAGSPDEGNSERELKGDVHHRIDGSSLVQFHLSFGTYHFKGRERLWIGCLSSPGFTEQRGNDTIEGDADFGASFACSQRPASLADVAQLVEQLIRNQQVIGSSPIVGSIRLPP